MLLTHRPLHTKLTNSHAALLLQTPPEGVSRRLPVTKRSARSDLTTSSYLRSSQEMSDVAAWKAMGRDYM